MQDDYIAKLLKTMSPSLVAKKLGVKTGEIYAHMRKHGIEYKRTRKVSQNSHIKRLINYFTHAPDATPNDAATYIKCNRGLASTVKTVMLEMKKAPNK